MAQETGEAATDMEVLFLKVLMAARICDSDDLNDWVNVVHFKKRRYAEVVIVPIQCPHHACFILCRSAAAWADLDRPTT
eukprot:6211822-Pleurochrysis_carterae.AAC.1